MYHVPKHEIGDRVTYTGPLAAYHGKPATVQGMQRREHGMSDLYTLYFDPPRPGVSDIQFVSVDEVEDEVSQG